MSKCISLHGEYSEHETTDGFACARCHVFDEEAALTRIGILEAALASTPSPAQPTEASIQRLDPDVRAELIEFARVRIEQAWADVPSGVDAATLASNVVHAQEFYWMQLAASGLTAPSPVQGAGDRLALGEVLARVDEHDYCHERIREWEAQEQWQKDAHPDEAPSTDLEDAEWWNRRADAALAWFATRHQSPQAALNDVRANERTVEDK